ncbi:MAG: hypothetical protein LQ350_008194 [Teloschistes chrysophthalmus]|nr:MAG: hypothetical protein LQ350_008194 [Niorma chrysophthalma]
MGLGILEPSSDARHVPGTVQLLDDDKVTLRPSGKSVGTIVLVPRPSDDSNDPLRWPTWKKDLALLSMTMSITVGGIQDSLLSSVNGVVQAEFQLPILKIENLSSYPLLASGVACVFASVLARVVGKRPIYLFSTTILLVTVIWSAAIGTNYDSFFAARFISGLGLGAYEALVLSSIGDMYFVHQRGKRVAFLNIMSLGPINLAPVLSGYVADKYGWRTNFWILTAFTAVGWLLVIFACPETRFVRPAMFEIDLVCEDRLPIVGDVNGTKPPATEETEDSGATTSQTLNSKRTYWQELKPFTYIDRSSNSLSHLLRLFACVLYPAVIWSFLVGSTYSGWFSGLSITIAQIFSPPPSSYTPTQLGRLNAFPAVGALFSFCLLAGLADLTATFFARRNGNIYEPEFRLCLIAPGLLVGVPGLALFGWYAALATPDHQISWVLISFLYGLIIFTTVTQQSTSFAYLLDAHRDISIETAVFVVMVRNFFSFAAGKFLGPWLVKEGTARTFYTIAGLQAGLVLTTVPLYVWGKKIRAFVATEFGPRMRFLVVAGKGRS